MTAMKRYLSNKDQAVLAPLDAMHYPACRHTLA